MWDNFGATLFEITIFYFSVSRERYILALGSVLQVSLYSLFSSHLKLYCLERDLGTVLPHINCTQNNWFHYEIFHSCVRSDHILFFSLVSYHFQMISLPCSPPPTFTPLIYFSRSYHLISLDCYSHLAFSSLEPSSSCIQTVSHMLFLLPAIKEALNLIIDTHLVLRYLILFG